jgi:hypothetical protein
VADQLANDELKTIESVIVTLFERMKMNGKSSPTGETALVGFKKFNGDCRYCGKKGHEATDCFKKRADERNKNGVVKDKKGFHGNCHHQKAECFQLQDDVDKDDVDEDDISKARSISAPDDPQDERTKFEPNTGDHVATELDDGWRTVKVGRATLKNEDRPSGWPDSHGNGLHTE